MAEYQPSRGGHVFEPWWAGRYRRQCGLRGPLTADGRQHQEQRQWSNESHADTRAADNSGGESSLPLIGTQLIRRRFPDRPRRPVRFLNSPTRSRFMPALDHPSPADLQAFAVGALSDEVARGIESHLSDCPTCLAVAAAAPDDTLVTLLRTAETSHAGLVTPGPAFAETM